ncbi:MAG: cupin domain-containing protein [Alphaproteobacteria bacterium]|nr:cupin domain-containing protein [Alphaproteobacteria bacterium]
MDERRTRTSVLDPMTVPERVGSSYPEGFRDTVAGRAKRALGDALGLTNFGVNLVRLPPGVASSIRHWHSHEDEFIYVLSGELVLVTDHREELLRPGATAGFPAGAADGHHLINRGSGDALYLEVGDRSAGDVVTYADVDLMLVPQGSGRAFTNKRGEPYR